MSIRGRQVSHETTADLGAIHEPELLSPAADFGRQTRHSSEYYIDQRAMDREATRRVIAGRVIAGTAVGALAVTARRLFNRTIR